MGGNNSDNGERKWAVLVMRDSLFLIGGGLSEKGSAGIEVKWCIVGKQVRIGL